MTPSSAPETMSQARTWERLKDLGVEAGLCSMCAAQLAWGAQNGFSTVHPPCDACAVVVASWTVSKPQGWRVPEGTLSNRRSWLSVNEGDSGHEESGPAQVRSEKRIGRVVS